MILIRSVLHDDFPEFKDIVRAHVHLTAYYIQPKEGGGCVMNYMTQTDMRGFIPRFVFKKKIKQSFLTFFFKSWAVNKAASILGQRAVDQLNQMSKIYPQYLEEQKKLKEEEEKKKSEEKETQKEEKKESEEMKQEK